MTLPARLLCKYCGKLLYTRVFGPDKDFQRLHVVRTCGYCDRIPPQ